MEVEPFIMAEKENSHQKIEKKLGRSNHRLYLLAQERINHGVVPVMEINFL